MCLFFTGVETEIKKYFKPEFLKLFQSSVIDTRASPNHKIKHKKEKQFIFWYPA